MKRLRHILQSKYLFKILAFSLLLLDIIFTNIYKFSSKYNINDNTFIGIVTKYELKENKLVLEIKGKEKLIVNYQYDDKIFNNLVYGDEVLVKGKLIEPSNNSIPNTFNYKKYLYNKHIYYIVNAYSIDKIKNNSNYFYTIKNLIYRRVNKLESATYVKVFLLGNNTLDSLIKETYQTDGIYHLFSISGMHLSILISVLSFYLNRVTNKFKIKQLIIDILLIFYLLLVSSSSLFRSVIMHLLLSFKAIFKLKISNIDIMFLTLIIVIMINPFIIYNVGFIYSYVITFYLTCFVSLFKKKKKLMKIIFMTFISFLASLPITIYNNYEINMIGIILNIFLVPIVSMVIMPLSILTFLFSFFDEILFYLLSIIEKIAILASEIKFTKLIMVKPKFIVIIIYYLILFISIKKSKLIYFLILFIILWYFSPICNSNFNFITFDVGQGDAHLISYPHNQNNILVDTGYSESIIKNAIIPYFKSKGIRKLDYLIITHGDDDHIGGAITLVNNFKVEKVVFNVGEYNELEKELIKVLNKKKIKYYQGLKQLNIDKYKLYFLNTKIYDNENDNSNVICFNYRDFKFLLMGDAEAIKEKDILDKYNLKDIDFLKVGHHGSNTSSSKAFIDMIKPEYSLISVGKNNKYGHPKESVLDTLSNSKIYRTDIDGSIEIRLNKNKYKISTCSS